MVIWSLSMINEFYDIKAGDLVRWFELYADGDIVKDGGLGSVLELREIDIGGPLTYIQYEVWRFEKNDIVMCGPNEVEKIKESNN